METASSSNKRIAKNALALYFRMMLMTIVSLYTSRIIIQALGIEDYGVYNVVGGFVALFSLVSHSITSSISRFLTYELGRNDIKKLKTVFSTSIIVLILLSIIIVILTETVGLWYLYNKMVIPETRMIAAFWCFQLSIFTFVISLISSPYTASIISHERMDIYAYISIIDAVLKLVICFAVLYSNVDKLILYAFLLGLLSIVNQSIYYFYCKKHFHECSFRYSFERNLFKSMFSFAGWNFIGSSAAILRTQGGSLLLNYYGGPIVNAANGISNTVTSVVYNFVNSFTQAYNPQITKRYASKEFEPLIQLIIYGARFSYYMMLIVTIPIVLNAQFILSLWLGEDNVPDHSVSFIRWTVVFMLAEVIGRPLMTVKAATGNIKNYQIVVGGVLLLMLPLAYLGLALGAPVEIVIISNAFTACLAVFARMIMLKNDFPTWSFGLFFRKVIINVTLVSTVSFIPSYMIFKMFDYGWSNLLFTTIISLVFTIISVLYFGCNSNERMWLYTRINYYIRNKIK